MALYDDLLAQVIALTNRPDLAVESQIAIFAATRNAHFSDQYPRDCVTSVVQFVTPEYLSQLDCGSLFPRLRNISRVQLLGADANPVIFAPESQMQVVELSDIYNEYGQLKSNVAYIAGRNLNIRANIPAYGVLVEWFQAPLLASGEGISYTSWIAEEYPELISFWAASIVFDTNGNEAKAQKYLQQVQMVYLPYLRANYLLGEGR